MSPTSDPEFLLTHAIDIGSALNELARHAERLSVSRPSGPLGVAICGVNLRERRLRFHPFKSSELSAFERADTLSFTGSAHGAQMTFELHDARLIDERDDPELDAPVLEADFPTQLYRVQRRAFYRSPAVPPDTRTASWRAASGQRQQLRIQNVSLGGVGLRSPLTPDNLPQPQDVLHDVTLDFNEYGTLEASLRVVAHHSLVEHSFTQGKVRYTHVGCEFVQVDRQRERFLERLVRQLDVRRNAAI
ncbi:flagellar brake protein [Achromobacter sp. GG226]|uniref:flagellar brake protein n=1 Tax=Verticiella alkaliphila TaxID=2779529 RepID=UPI001C0ADEB6|nr:flagellar brake protein [Verticiella sp. GG226]